MLVALGQTPSTAADRLAREVEFVHQLRAAGTFSPELDAVASHWLVNGDAEAAGWVRRAVASSATALLIGGLELVASTVALALSALTWASEPVLSGGLGAGALLLSGVGLSWSSSLQGQSRRHFETATASYLGRRVKGLSVDGVARRLVLPGVSGGWVYDEHVLDESEWRSVLGQAAAARPLLARADWVLAGSMALSAMPVILFVVLMSLGLVTGPAIVGGGFALVGTNLLTHLGLLLCEGELRRTREAAVAAFNRQVFTDALVSW